MGEPEKADSWTVTPTPARAWASRSGEEPTQEPMERPREVCAEPVQRGRTLRWSGPWTSHRSATCTQGAGPFPTGSQEEPEGPATTGALLESEGVGLGEGL